MSDFKEELGIITHMRGEVLGRKELTGENLFLAWGYPTVLVLLAEFTSLVLWNKDWCAWLWIGIPLFGVPLMIYFKYKDFERTRRQTFQEKIIMQMWIFIGACCGVGGFILGFTPLFRQCFFALLSFLCGFGCMVTGLVLQFRPKIVCGIIASVLSFAPLFFQGDYWPWQLLFAALSVTVSLIISGHLYRHYVLNYLRNNKKQATQ